MLILTRRVGERLKIGADVFVTVLGVKGNQVPEAQIQEMRKCFYAGAHHLFHYIMKVMEPGAEVTEKDLEVMSDIDIELREFSALLLLEALSGVRQHG